MRSDSKSTAPLPGSLGAYQMIDKRPVLATFGLKAPSTLYSAIQSGLMIEPIKLSSRCSRWYVSEVRAIAAARAAGASVEQLRALVVELREARRARAGR